jgi:hypothetical protein
LLNLASGEIHLPTIGHMILFPRPCRPAGCGSVGKSAVLTETPLSQSV